MARVAGTVTPVTVRLGEVTGPMQAVVLRSVRDFFSTQPPPARQTPLANGGRRRRRQDLRQGQGAHPAGKQARVKVKLTKAGRKLAQHKGSDPLWQ